MKSPIIPATFSILLRYGSILLAAYGIFAIYNISARIKADEPVIPSEPPQPPPARPYSEMIAANGIIEAYGENIAIAAPQQGLVTDVPVKVGMNVKKGDILFQLDTRELQAEQLTTSAAVAEAQASITVATAQMQRAKSLYNRINAVEDKRAIIEQDLQQRLDDLTVAEAQHSAALAQLKSAEARVQRISQLIERMSVRAPRDGTILQKLIRAGQWASIDQKNPAIILGRIDLLQARVDIDEQNASRLKNVQKAIAHIKGDRENPIELKYEYTEPFVIPKVSLTGASTERVDTRVLQVIFSFQPPKEQSIYVGQQVDVFIDNP